MDNSEFINKISNPAPASQVAIQCPFCHEVLGTYEGLIGWNLPVIAENYTREDGSKPTDGDSSNHGCPHCHETVNEVIAVMTFIQIELMKRDSEHAASNSDSGQCAAHDQISDVREAPQGES